MKVYQLIKMLQNIKDDNAIVKIVTCEIESEPKIEEALSVELENRVVEKDEFVYLFPEL